MARGLDDLEEHRDRSRGQRDGGKDGKPRVDRAEYTSDDAPDRLRGEENLSP